MQSVISYSLGLKLQLQDSLCVTIAHDSISYTTVCSVVYYVIPFYRVLYYCVCACLYETIRGL